MPSGSWTVCLRLPVHTMCIEDRYSYTGNNVRLPAAHSGSLQEVPLTVNSNEALLAVLAQPPDSVAIEADSAFFQLYTGGCHAALARHVPRVLAVSNGSDGSLERCTTESHFEYPRFGIFKGRMGFIHSTFGGFLSMLVLQSFSCPQRNTFLC